MKEINDWIPEILKRIYQEKFEDIEVVDQPLFERMIFDPRMKSVWFEILKRSDASYPFVIFDTIATFLKYISLLDSGSIFKERQPWINLIQHCRETREAIKLIPDEFQMNNLTDQLIKQEAVAKLMLNNVNMRFSLHKDMRVVHSDLAFPQRTLLAKMLCDAFNKDFNSKLWGTIAKLVEVSLDLPINTVSIDWIRGCCKSITAPL